MTNNEGHQPGEGSDQQPRGEGGQPSYCVAIRFTTEQQALSAYAQAQQIIYERTCDLSVYRFLLDAASHVAVLGTAPGAELEGQLRGILATGEPVTLPADIQAYLLQRRREAAQQGSWVERHYRPGKPVRRPRR